MKTIGIVGSRRRLSSADRQTVREALSLIYEYGDALVSGGCPSGADSWAEEIAKQIGGSITIHYPDWARHGRAAGFVRNGLIAEDADELIACVAEDRTGGTEDTITKWQMLHPGRDPIIV